MLFGEGNGNSLWCSCLKDPRDGGAWWAAVCGVAQSGTRLKRLSSSSSCGALFCVQQRAHLGPFPKATLLPRCTSRPFVLQGPPPPGLEAVARLSNNPGLHSHGGLPWWLSREGICLRCKRRGFDPCVRKIPWRKEWQPTPVFLPGESHGQRSLAGYSPWDSKESDTTEQLTHTHTYSHRCWWFPLRPHLCIQTLSELS